MIDTVIDSYTVDCCRIYFSNAAGEILYMFDLRTAVVRTFDGGHIELKDNKTILVLDPDVQAAITITSTDVLNAISTCCTG